MHIQVLATCFFTCGLHFSQGELNMCNGGELKSLSCASTTDESNFELCQTDYDITLDKIIMIYAINNSRCNYHEGLPSTYDGDEGVYGFVGNNIWVNDGCKVVIRICTGTPSRVCTTGFTQVWCSSLENEIKRCTESGKLVAKVILAYQVYDEDKYCNYYDGTPESYNETPGFFTYLNNSIWAGNGCEALFEICEVDNQTSELTSSSAKTTIFSTPGILKTRVFGGTEKSTNIQFDTDFVAGALIGGFSCLTAVCLVVGILFARSYFNRRSFALCSRNVVQNSTTHM